MDDSFGINNQNGYYQDSNWVLDLQTAEIRSMENKQSTNKKQKDQLFSEIYLNGQKNISFNNKTGTTKLDTTQSNDIKTAELQSNWRKFVAKEIIPDAAGRLSREEAVFTLTRFSLRQISPKAEKSFIEAFNSQITSGGELPRHDALINNSLDELIRDRQVPDSYAENLIESVCNFLGSVFTTENPNSQQFLAVSEFSDMSANKFLGQTDLSDKTESAQSCQDNNNSLIKNSTDSPDEVGPNFESRNKIDGNFCVTLPTSLAASITTVSLHTSYPPSAENMLEIIDKKPEQVSFHFSKPGSHYPNDIFILASTANGEARCFKLRDPNLN